jgi:hypothetical protein
MSVYEKSIQAFIKVIESESNLLSNQDWADLNQLATHLPEDAEEISAKIQQWLQPESRSQIREAYKKRRKKFPSSPSIGLDKNLGIANSQSPTKLNQPSQPSRELFINSIKKNSSLSDDLPNKKP